MFSQEILPLRCTLLYLVLFLLCTVAQPQAPPPKLLVRLNNRHGAPSGVVHEGRVEVSIDGVNWGTICSSEWSLREANVVCRQLGLGYADKADQNTMFGDRQKHPWALAGVLCRGNERKLQHCFGERSYPQVCNAQNRNVAALRCVPQSPDLSLGLRDIEISARLQSIPMSRLTCAMEEKCVSEDAYVIRRTYPHALRHLLRFTTKAENVGNADFSPYANYDQWEWHQCHRHFHSMKYFASFNIYDFQNRKVAQGHKASFCLMDTMCVPGIRPKYTCGNRTQGISIGCADVYHAGLDCQWVDVTNLPTNRQYILRVALNPEYKIGEISFENNGAECLLHYTGNPATTRVTRCQRAPLWFRR